MKRSREPKEREGLPTMIPSRRMHLWGGGTFWDIPAWSPQKDARETCTQSTPAPLKADRRAELDVWAPLAGRAASCLTSELKVDTVLSAPFTCYKHCYAFPGNGVSGCELSNFISIILWFTHAALELVTFRAVDTCTKTRARLQESSTQLPPEGSVLSRGHRPASACYTGRNKSSPYTKFSDKNDP